LSAVLTWGTGARLEGQVLLVDASTRCLAGLFGDVSSYARGRITGRIDFGASDLRSINDLTANIQGKLKDTQALQMPILRLMGPYLAPGKSSLVFDEGEIKGRLAGGVLRVSSLTLVSSLVKLIMEGSVTLQGRLDLQVIARTSTLGGIDPLALRLLAREVPTIGPVPVGLIVRVSDLIANRVVYLRLAGTVKAPTIRVEPLRALSEEATRFLIRQLLSQTP
jgi:hypothetical protein